jgi:hypothetical protein
MQVYSFGRISSRMSLNSPASLNPNVMIILGLKLSRSNIFDLDWTYPTRDSFDSKNCRFYGFFFSLFLLSHSSLSCIPRPCLTLPPVMRSRSAQRRSKMLVDPLPKRRNPEFERSLSVSLLQFLQMRKKRSCIFRFAL